MATACRYARSEKRSSILKNPMRLLRILLNGMCTLRSIKKEVPRGSADIVIVFSDTCFGGSGAPQSAAPDEETEKHNATSGRYMLILSVLLAFARFAVRITCSAANHPLRVGTERALWTRLSFANKFFAHDLSCAPSICMAAQKRHSRNSQECRRIFG